jgi:hypothetical protein
MTLPELHPDELLRRAGHDRITPAERADLGAHLERCPACSLELAVRADAAAAGISSEADHAIAARIVDRVLTSKRPLHAPSVAGPWRGRLARAAVIALMLTSTAVGASAIAVRVHERRAATARQVATPAPVIEAAPRTHRARVAVPAPAPEPPTTDPTGPTELKPQAAAVVRPGPDEHAARRSPGARPQIVSAPSVTSAALQPPAAGITPPAVDSAAAAVVLARAEQARAQRRFADATGLYDDLAARFPGSREEIVARVLHGQLLLDEMHDAPSALRWFERYLASEPAGALAEEARLGRAQALQLRGSPDDERAAWNELLSKHPASVHAGAARARLGALRAP